MADSAFGHLKKVEYQATGAGWVSPTDLGEISAESTLEPETPEEDKNTQGETLHAGQFIVSEVQFFDLAKLDDLETKMKALTRIDVRLHFPKADGTAGTDYVEVVSVLPQQVRQLYGVEAGRRNKGAFGIRGFTVNTFRFA